MARKYLTSIYNATSTYSFHGASDILLTNECDALAVTWFNDECISKIIENSKKTLNSYQIKNIYMPQNIGQVVVQAHFLASAAFLRHALSESFPSVITSKGLLIDKVTGVLSSWKNYAATYNLNAIPAKPHQFVLHLQHLSETAQSKEAVEKACNATSWMHAACARLDFYNG